MHDCRGLQNPWCCQWSDEFQKIRTFFSGKSSSRVFGAPGCHPSTLIDFANTALASKSFAKTTCINSEGYRCHGCVTGPMKFKKRTFFFEKSCSSAFGEPACHPSTLIDFVNTALASKDSVETIGMFWEGWRTHRGVNGSMNFKKLGRVFRKIVLPGYRGSWLPSKHLN